jgi:hypothetical protein
MKKALSIFLILWVCASAQAAQHLCTFQTGEIVEVQFPCDAARVARFEKRLIALYPEVLEINSSHDYLMGLYIFAMSSCTGHFADMSPEAIGDSGEPFFPRKMMAAMVRAGREVMCPLPSTIQ